MRRMKSRLTLFCIALLGTALLSSLVLCQHQEPLAPPAPHRGGMIDATLPQRAIVFGDSRPKLALEIGREDTDGIAAEVMGRIAAEHPAMVIHLGDIAARGGKEKHWKTFDDESRAIREGKIPFYPALGNHEFMGGDRDEALRNYFSRFPHLGNRRWYDVTAGNTLFIQLDSNFVELTDGEIAEQDRWLGETLAKAGADPKIEFVILAAHHPPSTNASIHSGTEAVRSHFLDPAKKCAKAVILFSGHVHGYERFEEAGGMMLVVSGGGGSPRHTILTGDEARHRDLFSGGAKRPFHFCRLTLSSGRLLVEMVARGDDGKTWSVADTFEFRR